MLILAQMRKGGIRVQIDVPPHLHRPALGIALGGSLFYLAVERFLDLKKDAAAKVAALAEVSAEEITRRVEALQRVTH